MTRTVLGPTATSPVRPVMPSTLAKIMAPASITKQCPLAMSAAVLLDSMAAIA